MHMHFSPVAVRDYRYTRVRLGSRAPEENPQGLTYRTSAQFNRRSWSSCRVLQLGIVVSGSGRRTKKGHTYVPGPSWSRPNVAGVEGFEASRRNANEATGSVHVRLSLLRTIRSSTCHHSIISTNSHLHDLDVSSALGLALDELI